MPIKLCNISDELAKAAASAVETYGGVRQAARSVGMGYGTMNARYKAAVMRGFAKGKPVAGEQKAALGKSEEQPEIVVKGQIKATPTEKFPLPPKGKVFRYILTAAQNNTYLFDAAWDSLNTLARHYEARIMVSRFTYEKISHQVRQEKPGVSRDTQHEGELWYDPRLEAHVHDRRIQLAPGLVWCGELNILPTAVRPLSGLESYTGRSSTIVPHPKIAMESVASGKFEATKLMFTTGAVTQRNYLQRKAGQKAEFHHGYGGLLVEVDSDGSWWCRQLNADSDGVIHDLDLYADGNRIVEGIAVEAVTWGDIHVGQMDEANMRACWGDGHSGCIIERLRPRHQFFHDLLDFRSRNHHDRGNPHAAFQRHCEGNGNVLGEVAKVARFLDATYRPWCASVVVDSNHDNAMERWLREGDYRVDPLNAVFFLTAQLTKYRAIEARQKDFHLVEWALRSVQVDATKTFKFLRPDESFVVCHDANGGIECGMHGHMGPNGKRGSANAFARMGRKSNVGHSHSAGIVDGVYTAGTSSNLDLGYNVGPSSWTHSHIVTHENGKRQIITVWKGRPWA